jgi:hypothetical protein
MKITKRPLHHFIFSLFILFSSTAFGQAVKGVVTNCSSGEPIPFVNVWIGGTQTGITTNLDGHYSLLLDSACNIQFSSVGFTPKQERIPYLKNNTTLNTCLKGDVQNLNEITIKPNYSYDKWMFKQIIAHKDENIKALKKVCNYNKYDRTNILLSDNGNKELLESINAPPRSINPRER